MHINKFVRKEHFGLILFCVILGVGFIFVLIGAERVNPANTDWVIHGGGDNFQHYLGWRYFRDFRWSRHFLFMNNLNYPSGTSIIVTDSNPLLSVFFKVFRKLLVPQFQFNGLWLLFSYGMIGLSSALVGAKLRLKWIDQLVFTGFCLLNPVILQRALIHDTLTAHWLILFAIFLALNWNSMVGGFAWGLLVIVVMSVHSYFLPMIAYIFGLKVIWQVYRKVAWKIIFLEIVAFGSAFVFCYFLMGYRFVQPQTGSYGELSMNLNAFVNPDGSSNYLGNRLTFPLQYEGFNYLGFGLLLLMFFSLFFCRTKIKTVHVLIILYSLAYLGLAVSHVVTWDKQILFKIMLPARILAFLSVFRSSGRLAWPFYYCFLLLCFYTLSLVRKKHRWGNQFANTLVLLCLTFQLFDLSLFMVRSYNRFHHPVIAMNPLVSSDKWVSLSAQSKHLAITAGDSKTVDAFALFAIENGLTFNSGTNARAIYPVYGGEQETVESVIDNERVRMDTLYILLSPESVRLAEMNYLYHIGSLDGIRYLLLRPRQREFHQGLKEKISEMTDVIQ